MFEFKIVDIQLLGEVPDSYDNHALITIELTVDNALSFTWYYNEGCERTSFNELAAKLGELESEVVGRPMEVSCLSYQKGKAVGFKEEAGEHLITLQLHYEYWVTDAD